MSNMTEDRFRELMEKESDKDTSNLARIFAGLVIISKYLPGKDLTGADHDIIYSVEVLELVEAGITEEEVVMLRDLHWMIDDDCECLAHYV